jgi:hypothetical protein
MGGTAMKFVMMRKLVVPTAALIISTLGAACGSNGIEGTYSNGGSVVLDIRSGGKADLTMLGELEHCTWKSTDQKLTVTCNKDSVDFIRHDDGSLGGPVFVGTLKKSRS